VEMKDQNELDDLLDARGYQEFIVNEMESD